MKKWKKVCHGCFPFLAAMVLMYMLTFLFLIGSGLIWGLFHFEQINANNYELAGLFVDDAWLQKVQIWGNCFVYLIFFFVFGVWYKKKFPPSGSKKAGEGKPLVILGIIVLGTSVQCLCTYALSLILPLFPEINRSYMELMDSMGTGKGILPLFYMGILAPVVEELIFRGLILGEEKREVPFWWANFIQAFLFGLYHQNIVQFVYAFCIGLLFGYLCEKLQSLKLVMLIHAVINISGNLIAYLKLELPMDGEMTVFAGVLASMILSVASCIFLVRYRRRIGCLNCCKEEK